MNYGFDGKVALVTGAGSGIGRSAALGCAASGARVVVSDVNEASGAETVDLIAAAGGTVVAAAAGNAATATGAVLTPTSGEEYARAGESNAARLPELVQSGSWFGAAVTGGAAEVLVVLIDARAGAGAPEAVVAKRGRRQAP